MLKSLRRHIMMQQGGGGGEYVQDGLIFWLDGIEKGENNGNWRDLIGGTLWQNFGAVSNQNNFYFGGNAYFKNDSPIVFDSDYSTLEVVFDLQTNDDFFLLSQTDYKSFMCTSLYGGNAYNFGGGRRYLEAYIIDNKQIGVNVISLTKQKYVYNYNDFNSVFLYTGLNGWSIVDTAHQYIGQRGNNTLFFVGKIYAVRGYNRILSVDEMLHNQQIDNNRFNL